MYIYIYMPLDNFITSIKLRLLSVQSNDIVDIYQHINVSDLKLGENKIRITNPQIIRLLKNLSRVYKVSIINEYMGMATISKTGEDYTTTHQYLLGYDSDSSDADADADADTSLIKELYTDGSSESGASEDTDACSESELHTDGSSESGASEDTDASSESELNTDGSSESGASEDTDACSESELHTDGSSESGASMDSYYDSEISIGFLL